MHMNMWKRNWEFGTRSPTITEVEIVKKKDYAVEAKDSIVRFEDATCLAMTSVPPKYDGSPQHIFKEMIDSGTSVALWSRVGIESSDEDIIGQAYRDLLLGETFFELPKLLLDKRRAALSDKSSLVNTLTLFYDNPCLLPRDIKLEPLAAAQERNKA